MRKAARGPPWDRIIQVRAILHASCDDVNVRLHPGWDPYIGYGRLNLRKVAETIYGNRSGGGQPAAEGPAVKPSSLTLKAPKPNPIYDSGTFEYAFIGTYDGPLKMVIYDISGRKIETLTDECVGSGGTVAWDATAANAPSGVYIARVEAGETTATVKFVVTR